MFIDVAGTRDRSLDLTASDDQQQAHMGDVLKVKRGARVKFAGYVNALAGGEVEVILDGQRAAAVGGEPGRFAGVAVPVRMARGWQAALDPPECSRQGRTAGASSATLYTCAKMRPAAQQRGSWGMRLIAVVSALLVSGLRGRRRFRPRTS